MNRSAIGFVFTFLALLILIGECYSQTDKAQIAKPSEAQSAFIEIPMKEAFDTVVIPVVLDAEHTVNSILDTGMPEGLFVMRRKAVESSELNYVGSANVRGVGSGSQVADVAMNVTLQVGSMQWKDQRVIVLREPGRLGHLGVDGAIGATLFADNIVQFDFENQHVRLWKPEQFSEDTAGEKIAVTIRNTKLYIAVKVKIGGKWVDRELLVDTGANKGLSINPSSNDEFVPPEPVISTYLGSGVGGDVTGSIGRIESLKIGDLELGNIATSFPDRRGVDGDGSIGMGLLRKFLVTFDYNNECLYLKPNKTFDKPTEFSMTGLSIVPDDEGRLRVHSVIPHSPADDAGIQAGDLLKTVNGKTLDFVKFHGLDLTAPGKEVMLEFLRDGEPFEARITLRRIR